MTDWDLVNKGILGLKWIMESNDLNNADLSLRELHNQKFLNDWGDERLLNSGVLMMSAYLFFVYPQQADFEDINFEAIALPIYNLINAESPIDSNATFCRRLRNSISHGRFAVNHETNIINFKDENHHGNNEIEFEIEIVEFGTFTTNFAQAVNEQMT